MRILLSILLIAGISGCAGSGGNETPASPTVASVGEEISYAQVSVEKASDTVGGMTQANLVSEKPKALEQLENAKLHLQGGAEKATKAEGLAKQNEKKLASQAKEIRELNEKSLIRSLLGYASFACFLACVVCVVVAIRKHDGEWLEYAGLFLLAGGLFGVMYKWLTQILLIFLGVFVVVCGVFCYLLVKQLRKKKNILKMFSLPPTSKKGH